jgi:hypothetical protein
LATGSMHARLTASKSGIASRLMVSGDPQFLHLFRCTWFELLNLCRSPPLVHRNPDFGKDGERDERRSLEPPANGAVAMMSINRGLGNRKLVSAAKA